MKEKNEGIRQAKVPIVISIGKRDPLLDKNRAVEGKAPY
jgi:hypothetical protein